MSDPVNATRKKYPGYNTVLVVWHHSIPQAFDPIAALKELANSHGLIVSDKVSRASRRLRVDSVESAKLRDKPTPVDRSLRQEAAKLLRQTLKDPRGAERIKGFVERARRGEDISQSFPDAMDPDS